MTYNINIPLFSNTIAIQFHAFGDLRYQLSCSCITHPWCHLLWLFTSSFFFSSSVKKRFPSYGFSKRVKRKKLLGARSRLGRMSEYPNQNCREDQRFSVQCGTESYLATDTLPLSAALFLCFEWPDEAFRGSCSICWHLWDDLKSKNL